ncbi:LysR substrate-binding domain-containing protein [Pseudomonas guariconensis]|uniref:LysR family transcriptional regulator n=1 Tax=Pseudomonas TaxID=286 RepID=UPI002096C9B1|nr:MULTISPECIES: LysR family transcriptional regulator [Pseudomonas]MCO7640677.1 LysR substrate-binding domain-containing protein [Pseudomonas sp. S 311-6]MCO7515785.1 LysR substrate-binding domain-containing protein [Pseudomonas putida]MCO7566371.1 LysR substrate-binding domain-containing protein [Pseudomonas mosselii]MCO7605623.1 LysR substrate-binding domain-containing protein [Pseudomonas guariconensis]MCO7617399.1 LysR substrate-binding domain-containing protein [Pseudomonas guariconensis
MALDMLREIQAFVSVAHKRSFVAAARALGRSPSAVTRAVQALEDNAGARLLNRNASAVTLTEAGERLLPHAERLLDVQRDAADELAALRGTAQGWIRFAAPELLGQQVVPAVLAEFSRRHPQVTLDVQFSDQPLDPLQGKFDFVVRGAFPQSSELIGYPLWSYRRHLYASPGYLAREGTPQEPEALAGHALILHTAPRILKAWHFCRDDQITSLRPHPRLRLSAGSAVLQSALAGAGIARLADWVGEPEVRAGRLVRVCPEYRLTSSSGQDPQMHALYPAGEMPTRVRELLQALRRARP